MSDRLNTEELIRARLEGAELSPSPGSWSAIQRKLRWPQFLRFYPHRFNIYYAAALLLAATGLVLLLAVDRDKDLTSVPEEEHPALAVTGNSGTEGREETTSETRGETRGETTTGTVAEKEEGTGNSKDQENNAGAGPGSDKSAGAETANQLPGTETEETATRESGENELAASVAGAAPEQEMQQPSLTYFTSSVQSGCAPLSIQFTDQSVHATSHRWDFGTGDVSTEPNPEYLFKDAGKYMVTLTTTNHGSAETVSRMLIEVADPPVADFQIEEGLQGIDKHVVLNLVNYSSDASLFEWCLVDESHENCSAWSSGEQQPNLELKAITPDSRSVRLKVISEHGCVDSMVMPLPLVVETSETRIKFPTAFSPNPSGPGDGSFAPGAKRIDLFHPIYIKVPVNFHMRVFTRRGELIFETRDVFRGWDGYMNQEAAPGDVYVWMAEGKWEDGESFSLRGDVTLVWNKYW